MRKFLELCMNQSPITSGLSPVLHVENIEQAMEFYSEAFDATEVYRLIHPLTGRIGHAEMTIAGCNLMLAEQRQPRTPTPSPEALHGSSMSLCLMTTEMDNWLVNAQRLGAKLLSAPSVHFHGYRCANLMDPFGQQWMLACQVERLTPTEMQQRWELRHRPIK